MRDTLLEDIFIVLTFVILATAFGQVFLGYIY